jgi:transcriptional/translational regulatory protein YebC/TACO1
MCKTVEIAKKGGCPEGYGENGTVKFFETLADNVFRHKYSMTQIFFKLNNGNILG